MSDLYGVTPRQMRDQSWVDPAEVRAEVLELLRIAREARDRAPWDPRIQRFYEMVFPQMTRWLPAESLSRRPRPRTTGKPIVAKYDGVTILNPTTPPPWGSWGERPAILIGMPKPQPWVGSAEVSATLVTPGTDRRRS